MSGASAATTKETIEAIVALALKPDTGTVGQIACIAELPLAVRTIWSYCPPSERSRYPFYASFGYHATFSFDLPTGAATVPAADRLKELAQKFRPTCARRCCLRRKIMHVTATPPGTPKTFAVGDRVLLSAKKLKTKNATVKLNDRYPGPYNIATTIGKQLYSLELPSTRWRWSARHTQAKHCW
ncbi:hypothetical protein V1522DRAFT_389870 [Lipomyces starkeyi]